MMICEVDEMWSFVGNKKRQRCCHWITCKFN
ncbi:MAG: IS1 family transposase [Symbiopectobacterium sp.]